MKGADIYRGQYSRKLLQSELWGEYFSFEQNQALGDLIQYNKVKKQVRYYEHKLTKYIYPQFHKKIPLNKSLKFVKVGFVSSFFFDHVISKLFKNWIVKLNKDRVDRYTMFFDSVRFDMNEKYVILDNEVSTLRKALVEYMSGNNQNFLDSDAPQISDKKYRALYSFYFWVEKDGIYDEFNYD